MSSHYQIAREIGKRKDLEHLTKVEKRCYDIHERAENKHNTREIANEFDLSMKQVRRHLRKDCTCKHDKAAKRPNHGRWVKD